MASATGRTTRPTSGATWPHSCAWVGATAPGTPPRSSSMIVRRNPGTSGPKWSRARRVRRFRRRPAACLGRLGLRALGTGHVRLRPRIRCQPGHRCRHADAVVRRQGIGIAELRTPYGRLNYTLQRTDKQLVLQQPGLILPPGGVVLPWPYQGTPGRPRSTASRPSGRTANCASSNCPPTCKSMCPARCGGLSAPRNESAAAADPGSASTVTCGMAGRVARAAAVLHWRAGRAADSGRQSCASCAARQDRSARASCRVVTQRSGARDDPVHALSAPPPRRLAGTTRLHRQRAQATGAGCDWAGRSSNAAAAWKIRRPGWRASSAMTAPSPRSIRSARPNVTAMRCGFSATLLNRAGG